MIDHELLKNLGDRWMLRYDDDGVSYGGYRCAPTGEWNICPKWNKDTKADCESGGFFGQGPQGAGYMKICTRVCLCETRGPMFVVDDNKVKWREFRILYTGQEALDALDYLTGGEWRGSITVDAGFRLLLTTVKGDCYLDQGTKVPKLTTVTGNCVLHKGTNAPKLTTVKGNCYLYEGTKAPQLTTVTGSCALDQGANAPKLTTVTGNCVLHKGTNAPKLTTVKGDCYLDQGANAPKLTTVKGNCYLYEGANAPKLRHNSRITRV